MNTEYIGDEKGTYPHVESGAVHIDGRAEGDGHGVELLIQAEALAQGHVHGDVRGGRAREESGHAALLEAFEHQRIGILAHGDKGPHDSDIHLNSGVTS